jgi:transcriptional regulator with XRE-family HTH domain
MFVEAQSESGRGGVKRRRKRANGGANVLPAIGARLRAARERAGLGVRELARAVGLSGSLISQIENGKAQPSVATLYAIVTELGLPLHALLRDGEEEKRPAAKSDGYALVQRAQGREKIRLAAGVTWEKLAAMPGTGMEFLHVVYEPGAESCERNSMIQHGGMEYAILVSGRLGMKVGFDEYELRAGDSISFDAQLPHRQWTIGNKPAVAIWAVLNRRGDKRMRKRR